MSTLVEKMRKAREKRLEAGGYVFIIRRPTELEMLLLGQNRTPTSPLRFVVGWEGVKELDLIPGGDPHPAEFDSEACIEWLSDRPDLYVPVSEAVIGAYTEHKAAMEAAEKN